MTWVKFDDKLHRNVKQLSMSDAAYRLWTLSWSYCADMPEPTGFLTAVEALAFARTHNKNQRTIDEIVDKQGWEIVSDGYLIHDYEKHLPPRSTDRVRAFRERKRNAGVTVSDVLPSVSSHARAHPVPEPDPVPVPEPVPSGFEMKPQRNGADTAARLRAIASQTVPVRGES